MDELFFNYYSNNRGESDSAPTFDNQRKLFEIFERNNDDYLIKKRVNILTIRLLLAQDSFRKLQNYEMRYKERPGHYDIQPVETGVSGAVAQILQPTSGFIGEVIKTETIRAHEHFYSFLTSIVSVLDRLANEIDYIYELNIYRPDWRNLDNKFNILKTKNPELEDYLNKNGQNNEKIKLLLNYRDVAEHDGAVKIEEFCGDNFNITASYTIKVQSNPRSPDSPINRELVNTCRGFFDLVVNICDNVYGLMIKDSLKI